jgi:hypothetical protein
MTQGITFGELMRFLGIGLIGGAASPLRRNKLTVQQTSVTVNQEHGVVISAKWRREQMSFAGRIESSAASAITHNSSSSVRREFPSCPGRTLCKPSCT